MTYKTPQLTPLNFVSLFRGWNFVGFTSNIFYDDSFSWNKVKGSCDYEKIYAWNPETVEWITISPDLESFDLNDFLGMGMVVKVSDDCKLSNTEGINSPTIPELPIEPYVCTDTDGGIVIDVKGQVEDKKLDSIYNDFCSDAPSKEAAIQNGGRAVEEGKIVMEYNCGEKNYQYEYYDCSQNGFTKCKNGACVN